MIGNQPPLADILADLGQWLQQWTTFIQAQIETKQIQLSDEDELPPAALDESNVFAAGQTAVPREVSSPPAHWLALFAEHGGRSLEEAAAASAEVTAVPVQLEARQVDTAVLSAWITQIHDDLLVFRKQVDPQFIAEQTGEVPGASLSDGIPFVPSVDDGNHADSNEMPLAVTPAAPEQSIPQTHLEGRVEIERKRPFPPPISPTILSPTRFESLPRGAKSETPLAGAQTIQRKIDPASEPLAVKKYLSPDTGSSLPAPLDEGKVDIPVSDSSSLPHQPPPQIEPAATKPKVAWPELPPPAPMNDPGQVTAVPSPSPHTVKRVTRLRLNPLPQRESAPAQVSPTVTTSSLSSALIETPDRAMQPPVAEGHTAVPVEKVLPMAVENRPDTAVPSPGLDFSSPSTSQPVPPPFLPPQKRARKGKTARVINSSPTNQTQPPVVQAVTAPQKVNPEPDQSQIQLPLPPVMESRQVRDGREAKRPLPPKPTKPAAGSLPTTESPTESIVWLNKTRPAIKPEPAEVVEEKRPFSPLKQPDYQIPPPPGPRQPPQWSVTPENRWPSLPPLPALDPNPVSAWRHQPARRQRLDREQQGTSWNE